MVLLWGGLRPIPSRLLLDVTTLGLLGYCAVIEPNSRAYAGGLTLAYTKTLVTAGWTKRWSLTIPMTPFLFLQALRQLTFVEEHYWIRGTIFVLSVVCLFLAAALCILFPAVELRPIRDGIYNVGVVDLQLPVVFALDLLNKCNPEVVGKEETNGYVSVRILYPTKDAPGSVPYFDPKLAKLVCAQLMKLGAPPPLKGFGWILHTWCLHNLPIRRNATPIDNETMPLVIFSHGLMGNANIYSHQGMSLASKGSCVLMINHSDGSSPVVEQQDGSIMHYNEEIFQLLEDKKEEAYKEARRSQTDWRVAEFISAFTALVNLNQRNILELEVLGVSFVQKLNIKDVTFMGHSFGGSTALTAAHRRPHMPLCVVAHEPAVDWMPSDSNQALFLKRQIIGNESGEEKKDNTMKQKGHPQSIHDVNMLFLYSHEWNGYGWGCIKELKQLRQIGKLGPANGVSDVGVIDEAFHQEFSDSCSLTPIWLGRATNATGKRNPLDTSEEISTRTHSFIESARHSSISTED